MLSRFVEDLDGIVGSAATWFGNVGNQSGETNTACVQPETLVVVVGDQLPGYLGNAIDGIGALDGILRRVLPGRCWSEGADRAGEEE